MVIDNKKTQEKIKMNNKELNPPIVLASWIFGFVERYNY